MKIVIIGYGNPLRCDDGVGWYVASHLAAMGDESEVQVLAVHQLLPELAATIAPATQVIFIDADCGPVAGAIGRSTVMPQSGQKVMTHSMTPQGVMSMAKNVMGSCPPGQLFTVSGASFEFKEGLTPIVKRACDQVIGEIQAMIGRVREDERLHAGGQREMYGYA